MREGADAVPAASTSSRVIPLRPRGGVDPPTAGARLGRVIRTLNSRGTRIVLEPCPADDGMVLATGDLILPLANVQPMFLRLRRMGLQVTALDDTVDIAGESVRLAFLAHDDPARLAAVLRLAFDAPSVRRLPGRGAAE